MPLLFIAIYTLLSCDPSSPPADEGFSWSEEGFQWAYNASTPNTTFKLPKRLTEISGLSMFAEGKYIAAVQDEDGKVFLIDPKTGKVEEEFEFWKKGDYEGIEATKDALYVLKSTGTLYKIEQAGKKKQAVNKFNTFLSAANDVEGLAYDAANNRLLLACKARAGKEAEYEMQKGIYSFNLDSESLSAKPTYLVSLDEIQAYLNTQPQIRKLEKLIEFFQPDHGGLTFSPSGIAIHPLTQNIYITSSVGKIIMVLSPEGKLLHLEKLKKKVHAQPEGICFDQQGRLYIANEGKDSKARLHVFEMN
ncbi:MAG: SdiA-regulated domain-containing protein [Bacteroidota bacterium]